MNINKIHNTYNSQKIYKKNDHILNIKKEKTSIKNKVSNKQLNISSEAKKIQETENLLKSSLDKLKEFDNIREEKLANIRNKIDSGFYFTRQFNEILADKMYSDENLYETIQTKMEMKNYLTSLNKLDNSDEINEEKIKHLKDKIKSGYYDDPKVIKKTADKLIDLLS